MEGADVASEVLGGIRPVEEAIAGGHREVFKLVVAKGRRGLGRLLRLAERRRIPVEYSNRAHLDRLCPSSHQGVVAVVAPYRYCDLSELVTRASEDTGLAWLIALDGVVDPMNLGAVLRVAGAFGVGGVVLPRDRAVGLTPAVAKAAAGALEHVAIARVVNLVRALEELKKAGLWVVGTAPKASVAVDAFDWRRAVVVVLGSEGKGMRPLVTATCDETVSVPLPGPIGALNVASVAAIVCYEICRQRREKG
ncbi:MAG: 23S rRNA (guanosine(2251)-2'-O)-methyltransferase RlmB [Nitrospinae bacterium]|nr:23S rRNA (guanosine(2251)-2'-O)-methyltransferase RlmB [Nitrospinota bacterium]